MVLEGGIVSRPAYSSVTMTPNDKVVKGCGGLSFLFTEMPRMVLLGSGLPANNVLKNSEGVRA